MAYPMRWLGIGVLWGLVLIGSVRETAAQRFWSGVVVAQEDVPLLGGPAVPAHGFPHRVEELRILGGLHGDLREEIQIAREEIRLGVGADGARMSSGRQLLRWRE